jgi:hypothetical protein
MGEIDTDTIGLIVLIFAIAALFIAAEVQKRKARGFYRTILRMRTATGRRHGTSPAFSDPPMLYGLLRK